jgi:uncharacterized protein YbjT (DUF2867 family)
MRIFVLGTGATGSLLARLLVRQGHQVSCGDKDPDRAHRFLGEQAQIPVRQVNARNLWSIVKAARGHHLIVNAAPAEGRAARSSPSLATAPLDLVGGGRGLCRHGGYVGLLDLAHGASRSRPSDGG